MTSRLGIDVGGSGIKGALVDLEIGELRTDRVRIPTPQPATPDAVAATVAAVAAATGWDGAGFGCALPAVVTRGVVRTAANIDPAWVEVDGSALIQEHVGCDVVLLNDADAAGIAEVRYGAAREEDGVVLMLTFGTGIGSAVFVNNTLVPNTELGHLEVDGEPGEDRASAKVQEDLELSWPDWLNRVNRYLDAVETILWPDLIVFGGGISKEYAEFSALLDTRAPIVPAALRNNAGIIGAALAAFEAA